MPVEYSQLSTCWRWECPTYSQSSWTITSIDLDLIPLCGPYHAEAVLGRDFAVFDLKDWLIFLANTTRRFSWGKQAENLD